MHISSHHIERQMSSKCARVPYNVDDNELFGNFELVSDTDHDGRTVSDSKHLCPTVPCAPSTSFTRGTRHHTCNIYKSLVSIENAKIKNVEEALDFEHLLSCSWVESRLTNQEQVLSRATLVTFTEKHLVRCYPSGHRLTSGNFDPSLAWSVGAQMVSLNFQANDRAMWLNRGKFIANGGCGFVRKPRYLIDPHFSTPSRPTNLLTITLVAGIGWEALKHKTTVTETYVRITIAGNVNDFKSHTSSVFTSRNRVNVQPYFNETFEFYLKEQELALVMFTVHDKANTTPDNFLAQHCSPVSLLRSGTRILPLYTAEGTFLGRDTLFSISTEPFFSSKLLMPCS